MFPDKLEDEIEIIGVINISGPVGELDVIEKIFQHGKTRNSSANRSRERVFWCVFLKKFLYTHENIKAYHCFL